MDSKNENRKKFWRSLNELENDPAFLDKLKEEFPSAMPDEDELKKMSPLSRRKFIALMSASAAFAAVSCRDYRDKGELIPYNNRQEEVTVGQSTYYTLTYKDGSGIIVKEREGRPIKIDGNPDHPVSQGKTSIQAQAAIIELYDPERIKRPQINRDGKVSNVSWNDADKDITDALNKAASEGKEIALVTHTVLSPVYKKLLDDFRAKYPTAKVYSYELFNDHNRRSAWEKCYGNTTVPEADLTMANIILALESDFLGNEGNVAENIRQFASRKDRDNVDNFNRMYAFEGGFTLTGANADYRVKLTPEAQLELVLSIINETGGKLFSGGHSIKKFSEKYGVDLKILKNLAKDLLRNKGKALVIAGNKLPEEVHIAVNILNESLGNNAVYDMVHLPVEHQTPANFKDMKELAGRMASGGVGCVIHIDSNPVYHMPDDTGYAESLKNVQMVVTLSELPNESTEKSRYILPVNHDLESWGMYQTRRGFISMQQPLIASLYYTRQKESILLNWISGNTGNYNEKDFLNYMKKYFNEEIYPKIKTTVTSKKAWNMALNRGVAAVEEPGEELVPINEQVYSHLNKKNEKSGFTVILANNYSIMDGRHSNNGWLQETPHPISKVCWDNFASISPATAKKMNVKMNDMIEVGIAGRKMELPVIVQPGVAEDLVYTELGYGRENSGTIANGVGFNTVKLLSAGGGLSHWIYTGASVKKASGSYDLASTQEHHALDDFFTKDFQKVRDIIEEGTIEDYKRDPKFIKKGEHPDPVSITPGHEYNDIKWAMAIDINKCTGCNQCVIACNSENNIPVVGKEQVQVGREMQWMRIDRYYSGTPEEPDISLQPMLCQHCDNAPCENVCPVVATNHSPEGLNQMIYNRCVGTRYCSNNCPYKVRRFNFFDYRDFSNDAFYSRKSMELSHNPEVTVRSRGVMEKCTFCVQRIQRGRQQAVIEGREYDGSGVTTACQDACPADAIVFGNINDPESKISKVAKHDLGYHVLEILNVRPNVTYIAKLKNKHSEEG